MKKIIEMLNYYFNIICVVALVFLISGIIVLLYNDIIDKTNNKSDIKTSAISVVKDATPNLEIFKVDIKGAVKKPGVYEVKNTNNVSDLIILAGGLNKNADTSNINLSRTLEEQMVIKIYTKSELKKTNSKEITECVCPEVTITKCIEEESAIVKVDGEKQDVVETKTNIPTISETQEDSSNKLISINTATKEELMTLNSIGESKANAIIEYRNTNGNFKSIEDIKNVSGIGDVLFEKIKSNITV